MLRRRTDLVPERCALAPHALHLVRLRLRLRLEASGQDQG